MINDGFKEKKMDHTGILISDPLNLAKRARGKYYNLLILTGQWTQRLI